MLMLNFNFFFGENVWSYVGNIIGEKWYDSNIVSENREWILVCGFFKPGYKK